MSEYRQIAALGSSFAAGPGILPVEDPAAMRSTRNYAHLLADRLDADLVDLTVSGATTATILDTPQTTMTGVQYPPQIQGLPAQADLVTVTAGGNDLKFAASMLYEAWSRIEPTSPIVTMMAHEFPHGIPEPTPATIEAMAGCDISASPVTPTFGKVGVNDTEGPRSVPGGVRAASAGCLTIEPAVLPSRVRYVAADRGGGVIKGFDRFCDAYRDRFADREAGTFLRGLVPAILLGRHRPGHHAVTRRG